MTVFVDTSAFYAVLDRDDANHAAAEEAWRALLGEPATLLTTNYVLVETAALLQRRSSKCPSPGTAQPATAAATPIAALPGPISDLFVSSMSIASVQLRLKLSISRVDSKYRLALDP